MIEFISSNDYPQLEIEALLSKQNEIPPKKLLPFLSEDGRELWDFCQFEYSIFHKELTAYFSGKPTELDNLDADWREYFECKKTWFLSLYELLRQSWKYLTSFHLDKEKRQLTPGLLTSLLVENECLASLQPALGGYYEISPRRNYELKAKIAKSARLGTTDQLLKDVCRQAGKFDKWIAPLVAILSHCEAAAREDKFVRTALKNYRSAAASLEDINHKLMNSRKRKMEVWDKGSRKRS